MPHLAAMAVTHQDILDDLTIEEASKGVEPLTPATSETSDSESDLDLLSSTMIEAK